MVTGIDGSNSCLMVESSWVDVEDECNELVDDLDGFLGINVVRPLERERERDLDRERWFKSAWRCLLLSSEREDIDYSLDFTNVSTSLMQQSTS